MIRAWIVTVMTLASALCPARGIAQRAQANEADGRRISYDAALQRASAPAEARANASGSARLDGVASEANALADDLQVVTESGVQIVPVAAFQGRVGFTQTFSTHALGDARQRSFAAQARQRSTEAERLILERRAEASRAWTALWAAERELVLLDEELHAAQDAETLARRGLELAELSRAEVLEAASYREQIALMILDVDAERTSAEHSLSRAIESTEHGWHTDGDLPRLDAPTPAQQAALTERVSADPGLVALDARVRALRAQSREVRDQNATRFGVGAILDRTTPNGVAVLFNGTLILPTSGRGARDGAELDVAADLAESQHASGTARRASEYALVVHELEHAAATNAQVVDRLAPAVESALSDARRSFDAGELTMLDVLRARRAALAVRLRRIAADAHLADARSQFWLIAHAVGVE